MNKLMVFALAVFSLASCSGKEDLIGKWDDNIKLSTKSVQLSAKADSVVITTEGDGWWIDGVSFEDSLFSYYNRSDINLESDSYSIKEECFLIERRNKNILFIRMEENRSGKDRSMNITLEAGNYFDYVRVKQLSN